MVVELLTQHNGPTSGEEKPLGRAYTRNQLLFYFSEDMKAAETGL